MKTKSRNIVSAVLISKDNKILLGKVREGGVYPDCWHIPGGGVEAGEDNMSALFREIKEELGIDIKNCHIELLSDEDGDEAIKTDRKTGEKNLIKMNFNVYQVTLNENSADVVISLDDDLQECQWVKFEDLKNYQHTPPSVKLFQKLGWI